MVRSMLASPPRQPFCRGFSQLLREAATKTLSLGGAGFQALLSAGGPGPGRLGTFLLITTSIQGSLRLRGEA